MKFNNPYHLPAEDAIYDAEEKISDVDDKVTENHEWVLEAMKKCGLAMLECYSNVKKLSERVNQHTETGNRVYEEVSKKLDSLAECATYLGRAADGLEEKAAIGAAALDDTNDDLQAVSERVCSLCQDVEKSIDGIKMYVGEDDDETYYAPVNAVVGALLERMGLDIITEQVDDERSRVKIIYKN